MFTARRIYDILDGIMPFSRQRDWDNSGLLLDSGRESSGVLVCLDVTPDAAKAAKRAGAGIILSHHPLIFNPIRAIDKDSVLHFLIKNEISVISTHTNFDRYIYGTSYQAANRVGLRFTPESGIGLTGTLPQAVTAADFAARCKEVFGSAVVTLGEKTVQNVYVCPGSGSGENRRVLARGADCYLTGECKYHDILDLALRGVSVVTVGHDAMEKTALPLLKAALSPYIGEENLTIYTRKNLQNPV